MNKMFKKVLSTVLAVAMLASMGTGAFAEETENISPINDESYTVVARTSEVLGDGTTLVKTLSVPAERTDGKLRFVGTKVGRVEHQFIRTNRVVASIVAYAIFENPSSNNIYLYDSNYSVSNNAGNENEIYGVSTSKDENKTEFWNTNIHYAKFTVAYGYSNGAVKHGDLWMKCQSDGSQSESGDETYSHNANQVQIDDMIITFG